MALYTAVYNQRRIPPINTAKNTQAVQAVVLSPLNRLAVKTAEKTITVENS
jgi:hypothetical protein